MGIINKNTIKQGFDGIKYLIGDNITYDTTDIPAIVSVVSDTEVQEIDGIMLEGDLTATILLDDLDTIELRAKDIIIYNNVLYRITNIYTDPLGALIRLTCMRYEQ